MKKHTNFTNEITGSTHHKPSFFKDPVTIGVAVMILLAGVILVLG